MVTPQPLSANRRLAAAFASVALVCLLSVALVMTGGPARAAATDIDLGLADPFAVLAGSGITNTGPTIISGAPVSTGSATLKGDVGTYPTPSMTGTGPGADSITTTGSIRGGAQASQDAKPDLVAAYNTAAAAGPTIALPAGIGGGPAIGSGVYNAASDVLLTGPLVLDGGGNPDAVFVFQIGGDFTTASSSSISLINGAQACHVYWQIGSSAVFGTTTSFVGTVMALTSITAGNAATFQGRLLARNGAVTLDTNTITIPECAATVPTSPAPSTSTPTATPTTRTTPKPTPTRTSGGGGSGSDNGSDNGGSGSGSGSGSDSSEDSADTTTAADTSVSQDLPNTGGPPAYLMPVGAAAVLAGAVLLLASRRPRGNRRA